MSRRIKKADKRQGELPLLETPTLGALFAWYEKAFLQHQKRHTQRAYNSSFRLTLGRFGEHTKPSKGELHSWLSERVARAEIMPSSANILHDHLHAVYTRARDLQWPLLLNAAAFPRFPETPRKPEGLKDIEHAWPRLLAALPDARARAFLCLQRYEGQRVSTVLGTEWKHIKWSATGGPEVEIQQQRDRKLRNPHTLKNDANAMVMPLSEETVEQLRETRRELMRGKKLFGTRRGKLAQGQGDDGELYGWIFPYNNTHLDVLANVVRQTCPDEFPPAIRGVRAGKMWHRFRHVFGTEAVLTVGAEKAKGLIGHKWLNTTQLYADSLRGKQVDREALAQVRQAVRQRQQQASDKLNMGNLVGEKAKLPK